MSNPAKAIPVERGCGFRVRGGVYVESGLSDDGLPLESFLIDPPQLLDVRRLGITPVGTKLIERNGVTHIVDWIGSQHYPNVADWIEETRRFGLSRRIARTADFAKLTPESRILLLHSRAYVENFDDYARHWEYKREPESGHPCPRCPKRIVAHDQEAPLPAMCVGAYWQDIEFGNPEIGATPSRQVTRKMPSFGYRGVARALEIVPKYQPAIFASFPITRLVTIESTAAENRANLKAIGSSSLPHDIEER